MTNDQLVRHFEAMGARVKFRPLRRRNFRGAPEPPAFQIDVQSDGRGEFFDFALGEQAPEFQLLQIRPSERCLLLLSSDGQRLLCGHDERHWFVAAVEDRVSTVRAAKQALLPPEIWKMVKSLPPGEVDNRRNAVFKRQGEWFFVPTSREFPSELILRREPLQRTAGSKPHVCEELYREGGRLVYVVRGRHYSEEEFRRKREKEPDFAWEGYNTMIADPDVYVRGAVKHEDHATLRLDGWHRVFLNAEITTSSSVAFLD